MIVLIAVAMLYYLVLDHGFTEERARAMAFTALVLGNPALILSNRSQSRSIVATLRMPNRALWWVVGGALGGLAVALYLPRCRGSSNSKPWPCPTSCYAYWQHRPE